MLLKRASVLLAMLVFFSSILSAQNKPNIIFVLADDMGYAGLSSYGNLAIRKSPTSHHLCSVGTPSRKPNANKKLILSPSGHGYNVW